MKGSPAAAPAPVLKWVGGKRQLLEYIRKHIPPRFKTYYEPFMGGGAVLFDQLPKQAVINDVNPELINVYRVIQQDIESLISVLSNHKDNHSKEYFYKVRQLDRDRELYASLSEVQRAARILYLNKTCYNGLFRVNQSGEFNTPFGRYKNPNILNEDILRGVHTYFNKADITMLCSDFETSLSTAGKGSFVYLDPPYDPVSATASFTGYDKGGFGRDQQIRLKEVCDSLHKRGARFLLSNSATPFILDLYKERRYRIEIIQAKRSINSKADKRGDISEVLVRNYG